MRSLRPRQTLGRRTLLNFAQAGDVYETLERPCPPAFPGSVQRILESRGFPSALKKSERNSWMCFEDGEFMNNKAVASVPGVNI